MPDLFILTHHSHVMCADLLGRILFPYQEVVPCTGNSQGLDIGGLNDFILRPTWFLSETGMPYYRLTIHPDALNREDPEGHTLQRYLNWRPTGMVCVSIEHYLNRRVRKA